MRITNPVTAIRTKAFSTRTGKYRFSVAAISLLLIAIGLVYLLATPPGSTEAAYTDGSGHAGIYVNGTVLKIMNGDSSGYGGADVKISDGPDKGTVVNASLYTSPLNDRPYNAYHTGSTVLMYRENENSQYVVINHYRVGGLVVLVLALVILVVAVGRWRGVTALIGLAISVAVVMIFIIPLIIRGIDAFLVCIAGSFIIVTVSIGVAHGLNRRTAVALIGTLVTLVLTIGVTYASQYLTMLNGAAEMEDGAGLYYAGHQISLSAIMYGGIIIASLGVLNDVTTGQSAAVDELYTANKKQSRRQLFKGAMSIGREHIAALINTLAVVYLAIMLPTIVVTALYNHSPVLVVLNSEEIMEEVVRSLVLSISLLLSIPLTTLIAVRLIPYWAQRHKPPKG